MTSPEPSPSAVADLETPCLVLDRPRLLANLARVEAIARAAGVALRPHAKTHKSLALAALQVARGAIGITASKPDEALVFIEAGVPSVTLAYPVLDPRKLGRVLKAGATRGVEVRLIADSPALVAAAERAAGEAAAEVATFMKVDVGLRRVGVRPQSDAAIEVAEAIHRSRRLRFAGLLSHAGQAYGAAGPQEIAAIAEQERTLLLSLRDRLTDRGLPVPELSVGSTPTVLAQQGFEGLTEIRPGNYVFMDGTVVRLGLAELSAVALTVHATVLSRNEDYLIVDAGSKVLSSDTGAHGSGGGGFGRAYPPGLEGEGWPVARLSEEHGWIAHGGADLPVGARVEIVPNHACPVANLVGTAWLADGGRVLERWDFEAATRVL